MRIANLVASFLLPFLLIAQNDVCNNPKVVSSLPYSYSGSTCDNNKIDRICNQYFSGKPEVFRFTVPNDVTCLDINVTRTIQAYPMYLRVMDGCPTTDPSATCVWKNSHGYDRGGFVGGSSFRTQNVELTPGKTYYIVLVSSGITVGNSEESTYYNCGDFEITITNDTECKKFDDVCEMEDIQSLPFTSNSNTCDGRPMSSRGENTCTIGFNATEYIYHYRSDVEDVCANVTVNSSHPDVLMSIKTSCRSTGTNCLGDIEMENDAPVGITLKKGVDYYFVISNETDKGYCAPFDLTIEAESQIEVSCDMAINVETPSFKEENDFKCRILPELELAPHCTPNKFFNIYKVEVTEPSCLSLEARNLNEPGRHLGIACFNECPEITNAGCVLSAGGVTVSNMSSTDRRYNAKYQYKVPGTYYIVISSIYEGAEYELKTELEPTDFDYGTCQNPLSTNNSIFDEDIFIDPCHQVQFADKHRNKCGFDSYHEGQTVIVSYTAPQDNCYQFTLSEGQSILGSTLFDDCPESVDANCLESSVCFNNCDSVSFSHNLLAGQTVYWAIAASKKLMVTDMVHARIEPLSADPCYDCNEDICRNCAYVSTETGEIEGWRTYIGNFDNPAIDEIAVTKAINLLDNSRHTVTSAGSFDPLESTLPVNNPFLGGHSIRLGNRNKGAQSEMMTYTYEIDENSTFFTYYYAVVFQDPGHEKEEQPYFRVRVLTEDGEEIQCGVYEVSAGGSIPGFRRTQGSWNTHYKAWSAVSIPVVDYVGQSLTVEFITRDCAKGDHFGYAYFDASCENLGNLEDEIIICGEDSVALVAPPGFAIYNWSNGKTGQIIYTTEPGQYHVDMETHTGCKYEQTANVTKVEDPILEGMVVQQPCGADSVVFTIGGDPVVVAPEDSLFWVINHTDTIINDQRWVLRNNFGAYHVSLNYIVPGKCDFVKQDSIYFVEPLGDPIVIADTAFCELDSVRIEPSNVPFMQYQWSNGDSLPFTHYKTIGRKYVLRQLGECKDSIPFSIYEQKLVKFDLGADQQICWYDSVLLGTTQIPRATYLWNTGETSSKIYAKDSIKYKLTSTISGCSYTDSVIFSLHHQSFVDLPNDTTICLGDTLTIGFQDPKPHIWSPYATTDSIRISRPGKYFLTLDDGVCSETDSIELGNWQPAAFDLGPDTTICEIYPITLGPSNLDPSTHIFSWNTGASTAQITTDIPGVYIERIFDGRCFSADTIAIDNSVAPVYNLTSDTIFCHDSLVTLDIGQVLGSILWSTGETTEAVDISVGGIYSVEVTNGSCVVTKNVQVSEQTMPSLYLGNDTLLCDTESLEIQPVYSNTINPNFIWTDGETSLNRTVVTPSNVYTLQLRDSVCLVEKSIVVDFLPPPNPQFPEQIEVCLGDSIWLTPNLDNRYTYLWDGGETASGKFVKSAGMYGVLVSLNSCAAYADVEVLNRNPPEIDLGDDVVLCQGDLHYAGDTVVGATEYYWSTDHNENVLPTRLSGDYILYAIAGSCLVSDTINIEFKELPDLDVLDHENLVCPNDSSFFMANCANCIFENFNSQSTYSRWMQPIDTIRLNARTPFNCRLEYQFISSVDPECQKQVYVPNAFSPNGDVNNELFFPVAADPNIEINKIEIRNRWGQLVFSSSNSPFAWDGKYNNKIVQQDVYQWQVWYTDIYLKGHYIIGHVSVVR
jgi:gliding motility-associated-like protein